MSKNPEDLSFGFTSFKFSKALTDFVSQNLADKKSLSLLELPSSDKNKTIDFFKKNCLRVSICRERFDHFSFPKKLMGKFGGGPLNRRKLPKDSQYFCLYKKEYVHKNHFSIPKDEVFNTSSIPKHIKDGELVLFVPPEVVMNPAKFKGKQSVNLYTLKSEYLKLPMIYLTMLKKSSNAYPFLSGAWPEIDFINHFVDYIPHVKSKEVDNDFSERKLFTLKKIIFYDIT